MKRKVLFYCLWGIVYIGLSVLILIWNFHEKETSLSAVSLMILAITAMVCGILAILDFKESKGKK